MKILDDVYLPLVFISFIIQRTNVSRLSLGRSPWSLNAPTNSASGDDKLPEQWRTEERVKNDILDSETSPKTSLKK